MYSNLFSTLCTKKSFKIHKRDDSTKGKVSSRGCRKFRLYYILRFAYLRWFAYLSHNGDNLRYQKWPKEATSDEMFCGLFAG